MMLSSNRSDSVHPAITRSGSFRPEIQGLRALAVGLVLLFHLWPNRLTGGFVGVDVFFVISGFLIVGHLHKELAGTGQIAVAKFWARRVMRLLPLAFLVLFTSTIVLFVVIPETAWEMNLRQITASILYVENWVLAFDAVDYMAADNEPSLVQHYWSLSIEEQFYFFLPLLFLAAFWVRERRSMERSDASSRRVMLWTLFFVGVASFIFSVSFTNYDPAQAYFFTPTRLWEFTVGGFIALIPSEPRIARSAQNLLGWAGIAMIVVSGLFYTGNTPFPGYTALLPVLGAALFIRYGCNNRFIGVHWAASWKPAVRMGDWSYAIYLWHWPLVIAASSLFEPLLWHHKIAIIILTFALAIVSQKLVEDPLRQSKYFKLPRRAFSAMIASVTLMVGGMAGAQAFLSSDTNTKVALGECVGANALLNACSDKGLEGDPVVSPIQVENEKNDTAFPECFIPGGKTDFDRSGCSLGADPENAEKTIAVFGSSHARMWLPMFDEIGRQNNWNIQGYTKSACSPIPLTTAGPGLSARELLDAEACFQFNLDTAKKLKNDPNIDIIVTASLGGGEKNYLDDGSLASKQQKIAAIDDMWKDWLDAGKAVVAMGEVPNFYSIKAPTCVAKHSKDIVENCSESYEKSLGSRDTYQRWTVSEGDSNAAFYDPAKAICDEDRCYSMVGGLITRFDHHHLSEDFTKSYGEDFTDFLRREVLTE